MAETLAETAFHLPSTSVSLPAVLRRTLLIISPHLTFIQHCTERSAPASPIPGHPAAAQSPTSEPQPKPSPAQPCPLLVPALSRAEMPQDDARQLRNNFHMLNHLFPGQQGFPAPATQSLGTTAAGCICQAFITQDGEARPQESLFRMLDPGLECSGMGKGHSRRGTLA